MSKSWASTLKLPKSTFPPRPLPELRPLHLRRCTDELYKWQLSHRTGDPAAKPFVLHDGPPYANGSLHVGHALNKILKDMILRIQLQRGRTVRYVPGWDCHGLPIELKALAAAASESSNQDSSIKLPLSSIRKVAQDLAAHTILDQMAEFRSYGIMGDWDGRYVTMDAAYEVRQLRLFQRLVHRGLIYRKYKPVYWSPSSQTALAEAELEYNEDHLSTAAFVKFPVSPTVGPRALADTLPSGARLSAVIWTTTPWTLPANEAIAVHNDLDYLIFKVESTDEYLLVAEACLDTVCSVCSLAGEIVRQGIRGSHLTALRYANPLRGPRAPLQPVIHADFVTAGSGSGLVHTAPGHGFEDYEVCMGHGLPVPAPVDGQGRFTDEAYPQDPARLAGLAVQGEGGAAVLDLLGDAVLATHRYRHKYPYDWRTKQPIIVRATAQWFADVATIKDQAVSSLKTVQFVPQTGRSRLESFVQGRSEWCISRQRAWGVPIPALYGDDGSVVLTEETVEHILSVIQQRGTDAWWSDAADEPAWIPASLRSRGQERGVTYRRGTDTMDVWFDSGSSWTQLDGHEPADVYLEGSDQHRGWFQSSLLTRVAALGAGDQEDDQGNRSSGGWKKRPAKELSPFKTLVTHGFLLDGEGKKMSKSLGNIVTAAQIMDGSLLPPLKAKKARRGKREKEKAGRGQKQETASPDKVVYDALGPDALRLWVASSDYTSDVVLSPSVLQSVQTTLLRYRTMIKMLLGSMSEAARTAPLTRLDQLALVQLRATMDDVREAYDSFEFYKAVARLNHWLVNDLSAFYLEAAKDRLYCGDGGGVLEPIFVGLLRMLAPVAPLLVEEAWDHVPAWLRASSVHAQHPLQQLYDAPLVDTPDMHVSRTDKPTAADLQMTEAYHVITAAHAAIKAASERARADKVMGSSLQCSVVLEMPGNDETAVSASTYLELFGEELRDMLVVSSIRINGPVPETGAVEWCYSERFTAHGELCTAWVLPPLQAKCPRCWRYIAEKEDHLCGRCADVVENS